MKFVGTGARENDHVADSSAQFGIRRRVDHLDLSHAIDAGEQRSGQSKISARILDINAVHRDIEPHTLHAADIRALNARLGVHQTESVPVCQRQLLNILACDGAAHRRGCIAERGFVFRAHFHRLVHAADIQREIDADLVGCIQSHFVEDILLEPRVLRREPVHPRL